MAVVALLVEVLVWDIWDLWIQDNTWVVLYLVGVLVWDIWYL
jgi:hypothetical protein